MRRVVIFWLVVGFSACGGKKSEIEADSVKVEADTAKVEGDTTQVEADTARVEADTARVEGDTAKVEADAAQAASDTVSEEVTAGLTKSGFNPEGPPPRPWKELTDDERKAYMREVVMPRMKPMMEAFDPDEFAKVTCATCHGPSGKNNGYEMPSSEIHKLPKAEDTAGWAHEREKHGRMLEFMGKEVTPTMSKLLGKPVFDPMAGTGEFGCMACHTNKD